MPEEEIAVDAALCLRRRIKDCDCRDCAAACPRGALAVCGADAPRLAAACDGCGICAAACPTGALAVAERARFPLRCADGQASLHCTKRRCDGYVSCLAQLTALELAYLGMLAELRVVFDAAHCAACGSGRAEHIERQIAAANAFLAAAGRPAIRAASAAATETIGRRELLGFLLAKLKQTAAEALPIETERADYRRLLAARLREGRTAIADGVAPLFWGAEASAACRLCGICARACKNGALRLSAADGMLALYHDAERCVGCGTCAALCSQGALAVAPERSRLELLRRGEAARLVARPLAVCDRCGRPLLGGETALCAACRRRAGQKPQSIY